LQVDRRGVVVGTGVVRGGRWRPEPAADAERTTFFPWGSHRSARLGVAWCWRQLPLLWGTGGRWVLGHGRGAQGHHHHHATGAGLQTHRPPGCHRRLHCTLVNPHVKQNSFIVGSHFLSRGDRGPSRHLLPGSARSAKLAVADDKNGKGWTCFGESPLPGSSFAQVSEHTVADGVGAGTWQGCGAEGDGWCSPKAAS